MPVASRSQTNPQLSFGAGVALEAAQDQSYTGSSGIVEHVAVGWRALGTRITTQAVFVQTQFGDADTCTTVPRPCPQVYGLIGGAVLLPLDGSGDRAMPERFGASAGVGAYVVRTSKRGDRLAPALQADLDLVIARYEHADLDLGVMAIVLPKVRDDFLFAVPASIGIRIR